MMLARDETQPNEYPAGIPPELTARPQWVGWRLEKRQSTDPKPTKVPYDPKNNHKAKAGVPSTWGTYDQARDAVGRGKYAGIGYEVLLGDPYTGIDLDGCRDPESGEIAEWGMREVRRFESYTEISPSGKGLHIWIKGHIGDAYLSPKQEGRKVSPYEAYSGKHFLTMTGDHLEGAPATIEERQGELDDFCAEHFTSKAKTDGAAERPRERRRPILTLGDDELLRKAFNAKNGAKFAALWRGDRSGQRGASEADEALIALLDFWTRGDKEQMRRLFMASGLYRPDEKHPHNPAGYVDICIDAWQRDNPNAEYYGDQTEESLRGRAVSSDAAEPGPEFEPDQDEPDGAPDMDALLLKGEADDNGNAEAMWRLYGQEFLYTPAYGWLRWTGTHWRDVPEPVVAQNAIITLKRRRHAAVEADKEPIIKATKADKTRVMGCLTLFKSYVIEPSVAVFDADPDLLNCRNGVLDLRTGTLTPHSPEQRFTYCLPVAYDAGADMAPWSSFVLDALGRDEEAARYFQQCAGYSLTGHTRDEKMFYLHGPTRAGKGTTTETLLALIPTPLSTEVDFATFTAKRENDSQNFDLAELKPARLVVASESNRYQSLNPAKIKQLTGGNLVRCAFKHKDMFTYRPQYKVWLVSNHMVNADAEDDALWGRVQVFTFPHSYLGSEDTTLKTRMKSPENLQGVLRWAVEGAKRWYEQGRLCPPESVKKATDAHRDAQDFIKQWIGDSCTLDAEKWTASAALVQSYGDWCEAAGVKPLRANDFAEALVKRFGCTSKRQAGTGTRGYKGISLGVTPEPDSDSGVTPHKAASHADSAVNTSAGVTPVTPETGEVSHIRDRTQKPQNQVSQVSHPPAGSGNKPGNAAELRGVTPDSPDGVNGTGRAKLRQWAQEHGYPPLRYGKGGFKSVAVGLAAWEKLLASSAADVSEVLAAIGTASVEADALQRPAADVLAGVREEEEGTL